MKVIPIIPSLNPDNKLIDLVNKLIKNNFKKIIVVDDGSKEKNIFLELKSIKECIVLTHNINKGKGVALKTAYQYYLKNCMAEYKGVITLDCDGQHDIKDVINLCNELIANDKFILGTRLFNTKETPFRNKFGNRFTSWMFKKMYGVYLKDTQTGLRAIPNRLIEMSINTEGERFEYEMNVLVELVKHKEKIIEVDIQTIYLENSNKHSNFKVFKDSYKVYKVLFKGKSRK